jgi:hypothetical protein
VSRTHKPEFQYKNKGAINMSELNASEPNQNRRFLQDEAADTNAEIIHYISDILSELAILAQNQGYKTLSVKLLEAQTMAQVFAAADTYYNDVQRE